MKLRKIQKAPFAEEQEYLIEDAPDTIFETAFLLTMKAGGLRRMLDKYKLDGDDTFRIEVFHGTLYEYSFIKDRKKGKSKH